MRPLFAALALSALLVTACADEDDTCPTYAGTDCAAVQGQDGLTYVACADTTLGPCSGRPLDDAACVFVAGVYCPADSERARPAPR